MPKSTTLLLSAAIVSSLLLAACSPKTPAETTPTESMEQTQETSPELTPQMTPAPTEQSSEMMKEGKEVSVKTTYQSPVAMEDVGFTLVLDDDGVITDAKTEVHGSQDTSVQRQKAFAEGLPAAVVGKKLSELTKIDRVGGSSLTTGAFNKALTELKAQI